MKRISMLWTIGLLGLSRLTGAEEQTRTLAEEAAEASADDAWDSLSDAQRRALINEELDEIAPDDGRVEPLESGLLSDVAADEDELSDSCLSAAADTRRGW